MLIATVQSVQLTHNFFLLVNYHGPKKNEWDKVALILKQFHTEKLFKTMKETSQEIQAAIMTKEQNNLWHEYYHPITS